MNTSKFSVLIRSTHLNFPPRRCKHIFNPAISPIAVTIIGANSRIGQNLGLLLKQCSLVDEVRLFDYKKGPCGTALDLSHIDTDTRIKAYTGLQSLRDAIMDAKVVVVCGGHATKPEHPEYELFKSNADYVRNIALYMAEFNPNNILCIGTPPITAMVPLVSEEYKKAKVYDPRKIIGISTLGVIRGNTITANCCEVDPEKIMCPVVGGMGLKTLVPVVSQTECGAKLASPIADVLRQRIAQAEDEALLIKHREASGSCVVSPAFAKARFITSVIKGLLDMFDGVECGFVRQTGHIGSFLPYMTSIIKLGKHGVYSTHMPKLNNFECMQLEKAAVIIRKQIEWGENYVTGVVSKKRRCVKSAPPCHLIKTQNITKVGDVTFDPDKSEIAKHGRLVPNH